MSNLISIEHKEKIIQKEEVSFNWQDSSSVQKLLDVVTFIIAEEYITVAKQNPKVFINNTPRLSELRGCALSGQGGKK